MLYSEKQSSIHLCKNDVVITQIKQRFYLHKIYINKINYTNLSNFLFTFTNNGNVVLSDSEPNKILDTLSKKSLPILYCNLLYKFRQDFLDIYYIL